MKVDDVRVGDLVQFDCAGYRHGWWTLHVVNDDVVSTTSGVTLPKSGIVNVARPRKIRRVTKIKPSELEAWFWRQDGAHAYRFDGEHPERTGVPWAQVLTSTASVTLSVGWCRGPNLTKAILELRKRLRKAGVFKL